MRILVTGGAGYLGSVLVPMLLEKGHEVTVLDNFMLSGASLLGCCHNPNLTIVRGDVRDEKTLWKAMMGVDVVLPLAAIVGAPACTRDKVAADTTNLGAIHLLIRLRPLGQWIIFPTTNSGYGVGQEGIYCTEETPLRPVSLYGQLKVEAERAVLEAGNSITLRLATVFGASPAMRFDLLVNNFVYRAVTDGYVVLYQPHFKRNYIHVRDVARAFTHCIDNFDRMKDNAYNVGLSGANRSKLELCQEIASEVPGFYFTEAKVGEDVDQRNYIVSNAKLEATGYRPEVSLREGIRELIKAYEAIGWTEAQGNVPRR